MFEVNFLGNIGTYRSGTEYGMGGAACHKLRGGLQKTRGKNIVKPSEAGLKF